MQSFYTLSLTLLASVFGTVTGFGISTILIPFLSLSHTFAETLLFVGIIHWFGDIWKMVFFQKGIRWKLILLFGVPGIGVTYLASKLPTNLPETQLKRILGVFLIAYVVFLTKKTKWKLAQTNTNALVGGGLSGFFAGIFGVGGAIRGTFLSAFNLKKSVYIFTSGAIAFLIDSSRLLGYLTNGTRLESFPSQTLILSILISFLGAYLAKKILKKTPQKKFRFVISLALFIVGTYYLFF